MKYAPHALILFVSMSLAFFTLGTFNYETLLRGLLASFFFFISFAVISHANMLRKMPKIKPADGSRFVIAKALGPIVAGDLVMIDTESATAMKMDGENVQ